MHDGSFGRARGPACLHGLGIAPVVLALLTAGCQNPLSVNPDVRLLGQDRAYTYSDQDWATVLSRYVHDGLVDYAGLAADREPLDRYYALLGMTGPTQTPDQFPSSAHATAYWINAYNALVLLVVLPRYPIETMYDLSLPRLESDFTFRVDGRVYCLAEIEDKILEASDGDVRTLFATSRAALGTPRLASEPMRATMLERQLVEAAADALNNPKILRIDHAGRQILVWQAILRRKNEFLNYWRTRRRTESADLLSVLMDMADTRRRRALQSAVGYTFQTMPFDRALNYWGVGMPTGERPLVP